MMQGVNRSSGASIVHWGHAHLPRPQGRSRVEVPQLPASFRHQRSDRRKGVFRAPASSSELRSGAEVFVEELMNEETPPSGPVILEELRSQVAELQEAVDGIQQEVDALIRTSFEGLAFLVEEGDATERRQESEGGEGMEEGMEDDGMGAMEVSEVEPGRLQLTVTDSITEASFSALGRCHPQAMSALLAAKEAADAEGWKAFQKQIHLLRLRRSEKVSAKEAVESDIFAAELAAAQQQAEAVDDELERTVVRKELSEGVKIVLMTGFEAFNVGLYTQAAKIFQRSYPGCTVHVFSDRDLASSQEQVAAALDGADVFFGSLLFDFDQVEWLRERIKAIPTCLVFESALELMSCTQVGTFQMAPSGRRAGPPPAVKKVLSLFGSGREEDRMVGYLSFLKLGPKLLKFIPGERARDLRNWLTIYGYWNQGGQQNVLNMFQYIVDQYCAPLGSMPAPPVETPATGCLHPNHSGYFDKPVDYLRWYRKRGPVKTPGAPVVAVLLYRKHVITQQPYIRQLITLMEGQGLLPLPIFINGVEAHTIVRDQLTSADEQRRVRAGDRSAGFTPKADAAVVDAVVNTIGFPLVGGPAGSMEAGRQADIAKAILASKNIPYVVAAPLLIQDLNSWTQDGIAGLQSVVLYSLPELDGAIDTVVLGGLVGNDIFLIPERVKRLCSRIGRWVGLRRSRPCDRRIAVLLYGFPPGVGATGTAALLNVPHSVEALLAALRDQGYDLGADVPSDLAGAGEAIVSSLKMQDDQRFVMRAGRAPGTQGGMMDCGPAAAFGAQVVAKEVLPAELKDMLTFPRDWGPSEWGPIPFLPDADILVRRMERQWGDLRRHRGINTTARGGLLVSGVQLGNVFIGVQPLLGIEGDPMRMLFERDLTPHPQYAAFYRWLEADWGAQAVVHFGMHGTVEWLPGSPLGNSGFSWSDVLLSSMPNVYLYACNNPSESVIAKRRGYGTIVSHNVPPYGRAGLYKQLAELKALLSEYREDPEANDALRPAILDVLDRAGLQEDCPFVPQGSEDVLQLDDSNIGGIALAEFSGYVGRLYQYLQVLENRIFSEGLHVLGRAPEPAQMQQYLDAYFEGTLPPAATSMLADASVDVEAARQKLEQLVRKEATSACESEKVEEAVKIRELLQKNSEEVQGVLRALNGEFILPEAGGDLLRDGAGVLPTGRNIHALDPYRMPSAAALERGREAAEAILESHRQSNGGQLPETVAVNLWGLDAIKTKGESVAMALYLLGAKPVQEGTGRIVRFELIPLQELGRPRIDVLCNMSGIFRDSFQNVVELLDDVFQRAAAAEGEAAEMNYVKKHAQSMEEQGLANPAARLFSNPAGDFGSMVNERVGAGNWGGGEELGETWASRNAFSYGRGSERGTARPEVLQSLLKTTDRIVQEIDSVEYGLTDIQEYYANTGALKRAAETARGDGRKVGCSIVESFGKQVKPKELEEVLRVEYRSKLLNPKWAKAMAAQGSGGAFEISQRMTAMLGWGATVDFQEDWTWGQAAETYVQDQEMAQQLRAANPEAFRNLVGRMLEANGRGMWNADPDVLQQLQNEYDRLEDQLEGIELAR